MNKVVILTTRFGITGGAAGLVATRRNFSRAALVHKSAISCALKRHKMGERLK